MNAESYSAIAGELFAPLYPYYAGQIVARTGIRAGACLDAGCGCGDLGLAVAAAGEFELFFLDRSAAMLSKARERVCQSGRRSGVTFLEAMVESIPMPEASFDLVVSRGSVPFWENLADAFGEIFRVLKPGGHAYIGGGLGTREMREKIQQAMRERAAGRGTEEMGKIPQRTMGEYEDALRRAGILHGNVERSDEGTWIRFTKPPAGVE
ncbi:MAG: class I SAM-dependent methyltransferase [Acidobacteriota bacterium]|nr:class I SAM-dependent methyltransferase [Acidobacteriota bacterium]